MLPTLSSHIKVSNHKLINNKQIILEEGSIFSDSNNPLVEYYVENIGKDILTLSFFKIDNLRDFTLGKKFTCLTKTFIENNCQLAI